MRGVRASRGEASGPPANADSSQRTVGLNALSVADGRWFFLFRSCRGGTGFSGRLMPAGHLLFWASKKEGKKLAGNAIPRSRLPSERKIAHSRVGSLYPLNEREKGILNRTVYFNVLP